MSIIGFSTIRQQRGTDFLNELCGNISKEIYQLVNLQLSVDDIYSEQLTGLQAGLLAANNSFLLLKRLSPELDDFESARSMIHEWCDDKIGANTYLSDKAIGQICRHYRGALVDARNGFELQEHMCFSVYQSNEKTEVNSNE